MTLTITLEREDSDRARVLFNREYVATFEPQALRLDKLPDDPAAYGQRLWAALGGAALTAAIEKLKLPLAPDPDSLIKLQSDDPELHAIAWEYLHTGADFLIFQRLFVREVPGTTPPEPPPPGKPWRLVAQGCNPLLARHTAADGTIQTRTEARLAVVRELNALGRSLARHQPPPAVRWQRIAPTYAALTQLACADPILYHFTGHGTVSGGEPLLCFDDGTGMLNPQPVSQLVNRLRGRVYAAFLNACRTADSREPGANLALRLVKGGIPLVLGTQYSVLDDAAADFAWTYYQHLAAGFDPAVALYYARLTLQDTYRTDPRQWGIPVLYAATSFPWPEQQAPAAPLPPLEPPPLDIQALQPRPIVGREIELHELATLFVVDKYQIVTVRGPGGMGKTALVAALAELLRFHFRDGVLALSLALPEAATFSAAAVRLELARLLGVADRPEFTTHPDTGMQETALLNALKQRPDTLLIWDNYETVLWALGRDKASYGAEAEPAEFAEADQIQRLVVRMAGQGLHLLFTSREAPVRLAGERLYPSESREAQLGGLDPRSASELFRQHAGERICDDEFIEQIWDELDGSPLALQLAASRWRDSHKSAAEFKAELASELHQAELEGVPYHQRSALVNTRLSINALPAALREQFLQLSIIANPLIHPVHAAVVWGMEDEKEWFADQAHERLERLEQSSLLRPLGRDEEHNRAQAYAFQPVIAQVARHEAASRDLGAAQERYGNWVDGIVGSARNQLTETSAQNAQAALPDILAAIDYLPPEKRGWAAWRASWLLHQFGRMAEAEQMLKNAEQSAQMRDDQELLSRVLHEMANIHTIRGDLDGAMALYQQSLAIDEQLGDRQGHSTILHQMAIIAYTRGDLDGAMHLSQQSLDIKEQIGDLQGKSVTLHQMAIIANTRGDLDGAMRLSQQSLTITEQIGDLQGKSAALHLMAMIAYARSDLDGAIHLYQQSLAIKEQIGDRHAMAMTLGMAGQTLWKMGEHNKAVEYLQQAVDILEGMGGTAELASVRSTLQRMQSVITPNPINLTLVQLAGTLVAMATKVLQGEDATRLNNALAQLPAKDVLEPFVAALRLALDSMDGAAAQVLQAIKLLLAEGTPDQVADAYAGVVNIAKMLADADTELAARTDAITAQRQAGADRETLVQLSIMLYNLAGLHSQMGDHAAAVTALEEVVELDERTNHPDLEQDRAALAAARHRASGQPEPTLRDLIQGWAEERDEEQFAPLLGLICQQTVEALQGGSMAARLELNDDLARLRALRPLRPLPIAGANDFLRVLQAWLRGAPGQAADIARVRASLPEGLAAALDMMERMLDGEDPDEDATEDGQPSQAEVAAMLEALTPEQRAELQVIQRIASILQQAARALHDSQATTRELTETAGAVERTAAQAAEGEEDGSPWLDGAAALRAMAARLRGQPVDPAALTPAYQQILAQLGAIAPGAAEENQ